MRAPTTPRWSFREPSEADVEAFRTVQPTGTDARDFSYSEVGATWDDTRCPAGYEIDHNRVRLGDGEADFAAACTALRDWRMFPAPWTRICPVHASIRAGEVLVMEAFALGVWWLNACRIVYVSEKFLDPDVGGGGVLRRFAFAYGTLRAHVEQGEERFSVELRTDGSVWYDLRAFSQPRFWPVRIAKPLARRLQLRFVRESQAAMQSAVRCSAFVAR